MSLLAMSLLPGKLPKNKYQTRFLWKPGFSSSLVTYYYKYPVTHAPHTVIASTAYQRQDPRLLVYKAVP